MKRQIQATGYYITGDPEEADHDFHYSIAIQDQLYKYHEYVKRGNPKVLPRLLKMIKQYPNIPAFRNYLSVYYAQLGNKKKAYEINQQIVKRFPEYLIGKVNLANQAVDLKHYDEALTILGPALDLKLLYPKRKTFHYNEFTPFMSVVMRYLLETDQHAAAESRLPLLEEVLGKDHDLVIALKKELGFNNSFEDLDDLAFFPSHGYDESLETAHPPVYTNKIVADLVDQTLTDAPDTFPALLALDRNSLIQDLATLLRDSLQRYHYWTEKNKADDFYRDFPIQAMLLLGELEAENELPLFLSILRQGDNFLEEWYGDFLTEEWWRFLYPVAKNKLPVLVSFMQEWDIYAYSKLVAVTLMVQVALHHPDRKEEVINHFVSLFNALLEQHATNATRVNIEFCSMLIAELINLQAPQLLELSKKFYDANIVDEWLVGTWSDVVADYQKEAYAEKEKRELPKSALENAARIVEEWY